MKRSDKQGGKPKISKYAAKKLRQAAEGLDDGDSSNGIEQSVPLHAEFSPAAGPKQERLNAGSRNAPAELQHVRHFLTPAFRNAGHLYYLKNIVQFPRLIPAQAECAIAADRHNNDQWKITRFFRTAHANSEWQEQEVYAVQNATALEIARAMATWCYVAGHNGPGTPVPGLRPGATAITQDTFTPRR